MKKLILIILLIPGVLLSQCVIGDCENGVGTYIFDNGTVEDGTFKNGSLDGIGSEIAYSDEGEFQGIYNGEFEDGTISGWGTETLFDSDGSLLGTYVGEFEDNDYNGWGIWIGRDKKIERGIFKDGEFVDGEIKKY